MLVHILHPQLECRCDSGLQRGLQAVRKGTTDLLRADQVQLRRRRPLGRREVDRLEIGFVQGQAGTFSVDAS
jgi:hypothetical protein